MNRIRFALLAVLGVITTSSAAHAGAWLQQQGDGLAVIQGTYFTSSRYFDRRGDRTGQARYSKYELQPYLEYGVSSSWTVGATFGLQHDIQSGRENNGIADPEIFARTTLYKDSRQVLSIQPLIKFESSFENGGSPRGGTSSTDGELSLLYGRNVTIFSPRDYIDVRAGYRYRSTDLNDQVRLDAQAGLEIAPQWQLIPAIRQTIAMDLGDRVGFSENGDLDYTLTKIELGLAHQLNERQSVGLTVADHVDGRQTGSGWGVTLGFSQRF